MDIVDERAHMVLEYIGMLQRNGYLPTEQEVEEFAVKPKKTLPKYTNILSPLVGMLQSFLEVEQQVEVSSGETYIEYLERLSWITIDNERVGLSQLGNALLRGLNAPPLESDAISYLEVVVSPEDKFSFVKVLHQFNNIGEAMLVDPYLRLDQFLEIAQAAPVKRILTSRKAFGNTTEMGTYQRALGATAGSIEVRYIESLHDRYYIPETGDIWTLGVSLNGIASKMSVLTKLGQGSGNLIRKEYDKLWNKADILEPVGGTPNTADRAELTQLEKPHGTTDPQ